MILKKSFDKDLLELYGALGCCSERAHRFLDVLTGKTSPLVEGLDEAQGFTNYVLIKDLVKMLYIVVCVWQWSFLVWLKCDD